MLFIENKYHSWYFKIIQKAQLRSKTREEARVLLGYTESHHIIPSALGGDDSKENRVFLSAREHFICHYLLPYFTTGDNRYKMLSAIIGMKRKRGFQDRYINSRLYEEAKKKFSKEHSAKLKGIPTNRKNNGLTGYKQSQEHIENKARGCRGKKRTPDQCRRISEAITKSPNKKTYRDFSPEKQQEISDRISEGLRGKAKSEQHKRALSKSIRGKIKGIPKSEETRTRMRKPKSESHRLKMCQPKRKVCRIYDRNEMSVNMFTRWIKTLEKRQD